MGACSPSHTGAKTIHPLLPDEQLEPSPNPGGGETRKPRGGYIVPVGQPPPLNPSMLLRRSDCEPGVVISLVTPGGVSVSRSQHQGVEADSGPRSRASHGRRNPAAGLGATAVAAMARWVLFSRTRPAFPHVLRVLQPYRFDCGPPGVESRSEPQIRACRCRVWQSSRMS